MPMSKIDGMTTTLKNCIVNEVKDEFESNEIKITTQKGSLSYGDIKKLVVEDNIAGDNIELFIINPNDNETYDPFIIVYSTFYLMDEMLKGYIKGLRKFKEKRKENFLLYHHRETNNHISEFAKIKEIGFDINEPEFKKEKHKILSI